MELVDAIKRSEKRGDQDSMRKRNQRRKMKSERLAINMFRCSICGHFPDLLPYAVSKESKRNE